ncbi:ABC transporter permease [Actinophytocola gossypii]|uniref:ABC transporter permease n=1 Tax=Actinophytocola gossypii TaxID=2812003 RepID=A0ABT2J7B7_9PSEU|nr:ABC transporter permease [Actinophytocola gossypii]MCT2583375.1 ABC transporter permease [Actinophytocola gossypii]
MLRAMVRDLRAHRGRLAMTLAAIVLGVAFVVSTWVMSDSTARGVGDTDLRSDVDVVVRSPERGAVLAPADLDRLAELPGVTDADGVLAGRAALVGADGKLVPGPHDRAGTGWDDTGRFALTEGHAPGGPDEVAVHTDTGLSTGDTARVVLGDGREVRATVVGTFTFRTLGLERAPTLAWDADTALALFGRYDRIELTGHDIDVPAEDGWRVDTGAALNDEVRADAEASARSTKESLLAFAAVALLVGGFVIANTFTMLVTQRVRQFALLRAVGATRRQVRRAVLGEAAVLGIAGATIGTALGVGLGLGAVALSQDDATFAVSPLAILAGYAVGVGVTVVAAYGSARRAAAVAPVAALRTDALVPPRRRIRVGLGIALLLAGTAMVAATAGADLDTTSRVVGLAGGVVAWLGVLVLAPELAGVLRPVVRVLGRFGGPAVRLGGRNAVRDPRRTAATSSALLVGLALVCAFATLGETMVSMFGSTVRATVPESTTVLRSASGDEPLATDVLDRVRDTPGVTEAAADRYGFVEVTHAGVTSGTTVSAIEPDAFGTVLNQEVTVGTGDLDAGFVVGSNQAAMLGVGLGDEVTLDFGEETVTRPIVGLHTTTEAQPLFYLDVAAAPEWYRERVTSVYATGPDPAAARAALDAAFADRPDVRVFDREGLIEADMGEFEAVLAVMYAMFGAAVVIAVFGVVNTLALSVLERRREVGVLRAVGASRRLVRRTVRLESLVICGWGGIAGIMVGVLFGAIMQHVMLGRPLFDITVPYQVIGVSLAGMVGVGVLAAVWPARRAAHTDVLSAIASE